VDFDFDRIARSDFATGALGAAVTALKFTPGATWLERAGNVLAGALASGYGTPALVRWLEISGDEYRGALAFVLGLLAMSLLAALQQAVKETPIGQIVANWLTRKTGG
jgi:hypothetical protein